MSAPDLTTTYLGLPLSGPVIASAGPLTRGVDTMLALQDAGAAAVVLPSLFAEEVEAEEMADLDLLDEGEEFAEFASAPLAEEVAVTPTAPDRHVELVGEAKAALTIPVIASINGARPGGWARYAALMQDAGADAIELNLYSVNADPLESSSDAENRYLRIIDEVRSTLEVPLAVKLSQHFTGLSHFAAAAHDAGADSLVLFNRFYGADLDLDALQVRAALELSSSSELRFPLRWIAILRSQLPSLGLAATSGVHSGADVVKAIAVGANVACTTSAVLKHGPGHIGAMLAGLTEWLTEHEYEAVDQLRGCVCASAVDDPGEFERAQYLRVITS